jgi:hypothetical protein
MAIALYVPLLAKPGKENEVADFLRSAVPLVNAEPGTISWFAIQEGPSRFVIFDTFDDEAGRSSNCKGSSRLLFSVLNPMMDGAASCRCAVPRSRFGVRRTLVAVKGDTPAQVIANLRRPARSRVATQSRLWLSVAAATALYQRGRQGRDSTVLYLCGGKCCRLWRGANRTTSPKGHILTVNQIANERCRTAWYQIPRARMAGAKMANWSARLATARHTPARMSQNSKTVVRVTVPWVRIPPSPPTIK